MDEATIPQVFLGADHGGFELKETLKRYLEHNSYVVIDCGAQTLDSEDDYPQFAFAVAEGVCEARAAGQSACGFLLCRSSGGMTIAANKVPGIRAVSVDSIDSARHARAHNDAHIASIAGDWIAPEELVSLVEAFLKTPFAGDERHLRRIEQITAFELSLSK